MKISPNLEKEILAKAAGGLSGPQICAWLLAERGIKITRQAVANRLRQTRVERAEVAKAVTREVLVPQVGSDLVVLEEERLRTSKLADAHYRRAMRIAESAGDDGDAESVLAGAAATDVFLKTQDRVTKLVDLKLHYAGADSPDESGGEQQEAGARIRSRLAGLAARAGEGTPPPGDSSES